MLNIMVIHLNFNIHITLWKYCIDVKNNILEHYVYLFNVLLEIMDFLTWFSWNIKWYILWWKIECHTELTFVLVHAWMFYARSIFNFPSHNKLLMQFQNVKLWLIYSSHPSNCWKLFKCQSLTLPKMQKNKFSYLSLCISKLHSQCPITKMD